MKNKKALIVGIIAAVLVLGALLAVLLVQCGGEAAPAAAPTTETQGVEGYELYYNLDLEVYGGKSEAGMSSRVPAEDGYFHINFFLDGETVVLKAAERRIVNTIDVLDVMGLEFDEDGIISEVIPPEDMPMEMIGWRFFVQSAARTMLKLNSSESLNGLEILLEDLDPNRIWDMSGRSGPKGTVAQPIQFDRVKVVQNLEGEVTHVFIAERPFYMTTHEGYCQHCDKEVTWSEWVQTEAVPLAGGHYQLMTDVQLKTQASMQEDAKICLDLNGHRIDGKEGTRLYSIHNPGGALAIMDTSEGQTGVIAAHGKTSAGGSCLWPRYGALYLYGGTVDASDVVTSGNGAAVYVPKNSYFYMFGGTIQGGTADYTHNPDNNSYGAGTGGNLYVVGKFVMHDGLIKGGNAKAATYYNNSGKKTISRGLGGNLYLSGTGEFEMNGGTIENGKAGGAGANIYATSTANMVLNGGTISGGRISGEGKNGGSIFLGSKTTTTINGGTIVGGVSYNGGGNVYCNGRLTMNGGYIGGGACYTYATGKRNPDSLNYNLMVVNGRFSMYGGKIAGGVGITDSSATDKTRATVVLSGYATICDGPNGNNLYLSPSGEGVKVLVGTLYESAKIGVNTGVGLFTEPTQEKYLKNFTSDIKGADIVYHQERLGLGRLNCVCGKEPHTYGCDETVLMWAPWTKTNSLPTANGNYYLLNNVTTTDQTVVTGEKDVKLDLNGKTVTYQVQPSRADGFRLYRADQGAVLTLTDTTKKPGTLRTVMPGEDAVYPGKTTKSTVKDEDGNVVERIYYTEEEIRALWEKANSGMLLWARGGTINVFEGIYDGSNLTGASVGLAVLVNNRTITEDGKTDFYQGKLNFYGGTILGGYTKQSGQVAVYEKAQMNLYGGTIRDGRSYYGGNIYVAGTLDIYGGTVEGGVVDRSGDAVDGGQGGNIAVDATGVMNLHGGTVKDGYVRGGKNGGGQGGNIYVAGKLYADGGVIERGDATAGGNIGTIRADSFIRLQNVQVLDGQADAGGNLLIGVRTNKGMELLEGTVISGGHARSAAKGGNGGNIAINLSSNTRDQEQLILIDGAIIKDGTSVGTGGNIRVRNLSADAFDENGKQTHYLANVKIVMRSGSIQGGSNDTNRNDSTVQNGGSVFLSEASEFILEGGTVEGGDCSDGGGNFYVNGRLEIRGGTVKDGTCAGAGQAASNIFVVGGELLLSGGTVDGNVAVAGTSTLTLSGKPVVNKGSHGGITLRGENIYKIDGLLESGASVYTDGRGYISQTVEAGNEAYLHSVDGYGSYHHDGRIFLGKVSCLCGGKTHTPGCVDAMAALGMNPADGLAMMPVTSISDLADGGFWYLPKTVTGGASIYVKDEKPLVLDLNGKTLHADHGTFLFTTQNATQGAVLVIADTLGGGAVKLTGTKSTTAQGGILRASGKSGNDQVFVLGGTLDASGYPLTSAGLGGTVAYVAYGNTLNQYGGTLVGRDSGADVAAGNTIHVKLGTYVLHDGTVKGGSAKRGGNIYVETTGALVMSGGSVEGGQATENGNNLYVLGELTMNGGEASGVYVDSDQVKLTGEATVDGLQVAAKRLVDVKGLTGQVTVTAEAGRAFAHGEKNQTNITSLLSGYPVTFYEEDYLYLGKAVDIYCVCGATVSGKACQCDGKLHRWTDWEETDSLPAESGYWRLTDTVNVDTVNTLSSAEEIFLDFNGQTVNLQNGENLYTFQDNKNARVVLTDSSATGDGQAVLTGQHADNGGFSDIKAGNIVELYRAKLDASQFTTDENGAVFAVRGTFVMHSGKLIGGKAPKSLKNGGTLWMAKGSKVTVESGEIVGGEAGRWGGAIYVTGEGTKLTMKNGTVTGGTAKENGGAIIVRDQAQFEMQNGTIEGGNLFVDGTGVLNMTGGSVAAMEINGNGATLTGSANVAALTVNAGKTADLTGLTGQVTVTATPGEVFATGEAALAQTKVLSAVKEQGFLLPVLAKDGKLYVDETSAVHCICGASLHGHQCQDNGQLHYWQPWTDTTKLPSESGYWRLMNKVDMAAVVTLADQEIFLDLNGQTVNLQNGENLYTFAANKTAHVVVTDSSKEAKGLVKLTGSHTANGGIAEILTGNTLEVYRATFDASGFTLANNGTVFSVKGGSCVMYSGKLIGGRAENGKNQKNGATLWVVDGAQMTMKGGTVVGGYADKWGGALYVNAAGTLFTMEGGTIEGGSAQKLAGNVMVRANATFRMTGGTITGGSVVEGGEGANVYVYGDSNAANAGIFTMEGGTIHGGVYAPLESGEVKITGSAVIDASLTDAKHTAPAYGLKVASGKTVDMTGLTGKVYVTAEPGDIFATGTQAQAETNVRSQVTLNGTDVKVVFVEPGSLRMGTISCVCGATVSGKTCQCDGKLYHWQGTDTLPTTSGYWRLTRSLDQTAAVKITTAETIHLDLNGNTVNVVNNNRLYNLTKGVAAKLVLTDSSKDSKGAVVVTGTSSNINGGILNLEADHSFELYRATLDASALKCTGGNGAAIATRGDMVIHSGTIKGGTLDSGSKHGATLWVVDGAQVTMKDGLIVGGKAGRWGGAMYVNAAGTLFKMEGGRIEGGTADQLGGSVIVRADATFHMTGGTITGGTAPEGANICVFGEADTKDPTIFKNRGKLILEGGTVTGGVYAPLESGDVKITGSAVIDASLTDAKYTAPAYGLKLGAGKTVDMTGLTGKVYVTAEPGKVFATGEAALAGTKVLSEVKVGSVQLPILVKNTNQLYLDEATSVHCICGATVSGKTCQCDGKLYHWQGTDTLPTTSGYWRLTKSLDQTSAVKITTAETIHLDLNGNTVNVVNNNRLYNLTKNVATKLVLTDSSKDSKGAVVVTGTSSNINGGILDLQVGNSFELYRATLDASGLKCTGGNGAAIATRGNMVIHSGTIKGGTLDSGSKHGATLWVVDGAQVTMKDGLIVGGKAGRWGGAMYVNAAGTLFKMEGGRIEGGTADQLGGSVIVRADATFHMTGGTITGGTAPEGANICVYGEADKNDPTIFKNRGKLILEGGTVTGGVYAPLESGDVKITGSAVIDASLTDDPYTAPAYGLKLAAGKTVDMTGLTGKVYVTAEPGKSFATGATAAMAETNVISETKLNGTALKVLFVEPDKLHMGALYCVCGASLHGYTCQCNNNVQLWTDWTDTTKLPSKTGYYRLTGTVDVGTVITLSTAEQIYLDLNGQTVNLQNGENLYTFQDNKGALVVITDTSRDARGKAVLTGEHTSNGGFSDIMVGNTVQLYRATLDASQFTTKQNGSVFAVRGNFEMHSGKLIGGQCKNTNNKNGGTLWLSNCPGAIIRGGEVIGGETDNMAGTIYVGGASTLEIYGGTITGGDARLDGDNIHVNNTGAIFRMYGGTVTGGLYVASAKEVTITQNAVINKELTDSKYVKPAYSLKLASGKTVDVTGLTGTVYVSGTADTVFATGATAAMAESKVLSEDAALKVVLTESTKLMLTAK